MSRPHALAPLIGAGPSARGPGPEILPAASVAGRPGLPVAECYFERALLLWPRLDRARLHRLRNDPRLIAEFVAHRTSASHDVILAMLTRQARVASLTEGSPGFESGRSEAARLALRVVRVEN
jgi:hypothetical protein